MARRKTNLYLPIGVGSVLILVAAVAASSYLSSRNVPEEGDGRPLVGAGGPAPSPMTAVLGPAAACSKRGYQALIKTRAKDLKVPEPSIETLSEPLKGGVEFDGRRVMKPLRDQIETPHLRIATSVDRVGELGSGAGFRADNLLLTITNLSDNPVAYRVETQMDVFDRCGSRAAISHNAVVLNPHETIRRSECTYHPRMKLTLTHIEAYEVSFLGHRFLSRLSPEPASPFDLRVAAPHSFGGQRACRSLPWRGLEGEAIERWRRVVDFYARHDCDEYTMPATYEIFKAPGRLPACEKTVDDSAVGP